MVFINGKECVSISLVHVEGKVLMKHDPKTQRLCTISSTVNHNDILSVITGDAANDLVLKKVSEFIDVERNMIKAAFAYSALKEASDTFGLEEILESDNIKILEDKKHTTDICLGEKNDKNIHVFSISIEPSRAKQDELAEQFVMVDRQKVITKPSTTPQDNTLDFYFMGMKIEKLSGVAILIFGNNTFI
jgi:hypothetical protein